MATTPGQLSVRQETAIVLLVLPLLITGFYIQPEVILFSEHPRSLFVLANSSFSLRCSVILALDVVEQLPLPQIVWDFDGKVVPGVGSTNNSESVLEIGSATSGDTGWYRCLVIDGNNASLCQGDFPCLTTITASQAAYVKVIDDSPLSKMVNASSACAAMVIRCLDHPHGLMERTFPVAWTREGFPVNDSSTQLLPSGDLILKPSEELFGTYQCNTTSPLSGSPITLNEVTVQLNENENVGELFLTVELQASSTVVAVDTAFELVCTVEGPCDWSTVSWSKDGQALEMGSATGEEAESVAVVIPSATLDHDGRYCCSVENETSCINIVVISSVSNSTTHLVNTTGHDPTLLTLDCSPWPSGAGVTSLWLHDGNVISTGAQQLAVNVTGTPSNATMGIFQCFLGNLSSPAIALHRLLPLGWPNPPGNLSYVPIEVSGTYSQIALSWQPPTYIGGLNEGSYNYTLFYALEGYGVVDVDHFDGNVTVAPVVLYSSPYISLLSIAINASDDLVQAVSERSQPLTLSGHLCDIYLSQPPNVTLECEQDGQSAHLQWKGMDTDFTYYYSTSGTTIEIDCYYVNNTDNIITDTSTKDVGSIHLTSLQEGDVCEFAGVNAQCEATSTTGSCTIRSPSYSPTSTLMQSTTHSVTSAAPSSLTIITFATSIGSYSELNTTAMMSTIHSIMTSTIHSAMTSTIQSSVTSTIHSIVPSTIVSITSPFSVASLNRSFTGATSFVPSTSPPSNTTLTPLPTLYTTVIIVSVVAGGLLLAFLISALLLIANYHHQRSKSKEDDDQWPEDPENYPPLSLLAEVGEDAVSCHTVYAQINTQELLDSLNGHGSPTKVDLGTSVVTITEDEKEDQRGLGFPPRHDSTGDVVYSTSSSRKTSTDTSASSIETDSGYIHYGNTTYASFGNSEVHLNKRLEAIREDLELCHTAPSMAEGDDAYPDDKEPEVDTIFQEVDHGDQDAPNLESDCTSENSTSLIPPAINVVTPEMTT